METLTKLEIMSATPVQRENKATPVWERHDASVRRTVESKDKQPMGMSDGWLRGLGIN